MILLNAVVDIYSFSAHFWKNIADQL